MPWPYRTKTRKGSPKLTEDQVREIRSKGHTHSRKELSLEYGVSVVAIRNIVKGYSWKWVKDDAV